MDLFINIDHAVLTAPGDMTLSQLTIIYAITAFLSLCLLIGCCLINKKGEIWLKVLFFCVLVVNVGYLLLSVSQNLNQALNANRLAYLGSVFLPLSMLMIILRVTRISYPRWLPHSLLGFSILVFLIAASPGILNIYYAEVAFHRVEGMVILQKVYGPLHPIYLVYLSGYFIAMVAVIIRSVMTKKILSTAYACVLAVAVFVNIAVWLVEQFLDNRFEFLAVSYIISELFLLGLCLVMAEAEKKQTPAVVSTEPAPSVNSEQLAMFTQGLASLTPKEQEIYDCYLKDMTTEEILEALHITQNTLKFHNKNLYGKLGVKSRRQLKEIQRTL